MARPRIQDLAGTLHHVITRGHNRKAVFQWESDFQQFQELLEWHLMQVPCQLHAYVIMPNHYHLIISVRQDGGMGELMRRLNGDYACYFNSSRQRSGSVWEHRYWSEPKETDEKQMTCQLYIERNPPRARLVRHAQDWRWSSAGHYLGLRSWSQLSPLNWLLDLSKSTQHWRAVYREMLEEPDFNRSV